MRHTDEGPPHSWANNGRMENHCLALLLYVTEHPSDLQSYTILSEATGVPEGSLKGILSFHRNHSTCQSAKTDCYLCKTAMKYGFKIGRSRGQLLTATKDNKEFTTSEDIQRENAVFRRGHPEICPECGGKVVQDRNGEYLCSECGLVLEGG